MYNNEIELLKNSYPEPALSSVSVLIALLVLGGVFTVNKNKNKAYPWYTRLNPDCFMYGFTNIDKFNFEYPKKITNIWSNDRLQTSFAPRHVKQQKTK
ncbi:MAG: hypothetical protein JW974_02580 [Alphaproteobacteria bacterium]|nr:hypothetical protein [Alphaproteobacteria bacterium]MBN2675182.1 hypothetical protein [Alphaproteobacteria bacterium]